MTLILFSGCAETPKAALPFDLDSNGNYTGFGNLPEKYTPGQAEKDGCYVRVDSKTAGGEQLWKDFVKAAAEGKDASIRVVNVYGDETYFCDLFHADGYYRAFDSSSEDLHDKKFKYLLALKGTLPNAAKSGKVTILTDDKDLTYDAVMKKFLTSDMRIAEAIPPFELLFTE